MKQGFPRTIIKRHFLSYTVAVRILNELSYFGVVQLAQLVRNIGQAGAPRSRCCCIRGLVHSSFQFHLLVRT